MNEALILASASPRRRELLGYMGVPFTVVSADAEEVETGTPREIVEKNALLKGETVLRRCPGRVVLAADTLVNVDGEVLGKPKDAQDAKRMLRLLSGAWHEVHTGVALFSMKGIARRHVVTRVHFVTLSEETIERYVLSGEPMDKAGAYALQGIGGMFVDSIEGSYSNVIGLPMATVRALLIEAGYAL